MRGLSDSVVVITGASSGIGRATAHAFARHGATVVAAARRGDKLSEVVKECGALGGQCIAMPCDMADEQQVEVLSDEILESFGRIDVWVNNAGVAAFGRIDEMPYELYRKVIETNLLGYVHGCRAAMSCFRRQGEGVLINVASVAGKVGQPFTSAYCASKFGVVGLSDSLRMEVRKDPEIHVCTVLPPSIDTPLFQHGANYAGRQAQPIPPVYSAQQVARIIVNLARHPRREVAVGAAGKLLVNLHRFSPALTERLVARSVERQHFSHEKAPEGAGNLVQPAADEYGVSGGWQEVSERSGKVKGLIGVGLALAGASAAYWLAQRAMAARRVEEPRREEEPAELVERREFPAGAYVEPWPT